MFEPNAPEKNLEAALRQIIDATSRNDVARTTAARWFNRLYYDVRK